MAKKRTAARVATRRRAATKKTSQPDSVPVLTRFDAVPDPPETLGEFGRKYWIRVAPLLIELGYLTPLHLESFEALCECWDTYCRTLRELKDNPEMGTFKTQAGYEQETPKARALDSALKHLQRLWAKFGLTPHAAGTIKGQGSRTGSKIQGFAAKKTAHDEEHRPNE